MIVIDQIADFLANQGLGTVGVDIFSSYLPKEPDDAVVIIDTGGGEQDIEIPTKDITFQVIVRNTDYATGKADIETVRSSLHQQKNFKVYDGEDFFYFILATSGGGHIGRDTNGRDEFSINFRARLQ